MSTDDVEITGQKGDDTLRNAPHARFDCVVFKMEKRCTDVAVCEKACDFCYCWVCDKPWKQCASWKEHCICDGGPEWNLKRQKHKRNLEAEQAQAQARATGRQKDMADPAEIRRRYENDAAGQGGAMPRSDAEEMRREASEQQAEDEEVEQVFAAYEPIHLDYGQPHPDAVVETTSLSFAQLPPITMHSNLPQGMQKPKTASNPYGRALQPADRDGRVRGHAAQHGAAQRQHRRLLPRRRCRARQGASAGGDHPRQLEPGPQAPPVGLGLG